jgi:hypothetical protein
MQTHLTQWLLAGFLVAVAPSCISLGIGTAAATGQADTVSATGARLGTALQATGPNPSLGDQAKVFGRLIGTWDVEYTDFSKDGKVVHRSGELSFGWVLDGHVMQDLWVVYPSAEGKAREVYTDLFYFNPKSGTWADVFLDPQDASFATFTGGASGNDRIVLDSRDLVPGQIRRWSFNDIRGDALVFRDDASGDGGKTWTLKSEYHMKRRGEGPPAQQPAQQ